MFKLTVVVRDAGSDEPDYSLDFELPAVPRVGEYISIQRPDKPAPYSEDLIVRHVWWQMSHPSTGAFGTDKPEVGGLIDITVECDQAIGPYSNDQWRDRLVATRDRGIDVEDMPFRRVSVREDAFKK